jgi:hypothetical protein
LIATSRTPNAWPSPVSRGLRARVRAHLVPGSPTGAKRRRPRAVWAGAGLAVLAGLTAWAVASVSVWLVPAYLALMVLIFVTPRRRRLSELPAKLGEAPVGVATDFGQGLRVDRAVEVDGHHPAAGPELDSATDEATETSGSGPDPAGSSTAKLRRGRVRARKGAKTTTEPVPDSSPITWIRVGPGKFVRADTDIHAVDAVPTEEAAAEANPAVGAPAPTLHAASQVQTEADSATDNSVPMTPLSTAPQTAPAERHPPSLPETTSGEVGTVLASNRWVSGPATEEHGIAPSAFGPPLLATSSVGAGEASARRNVRTGPKRRLSAGFSFAPDLPLQQAARRAFGRIAHVQRTLRPRSPPGRLIYLSR